MNIQLINRKEEGELLLEGSLDSVTSQEAEPIFDQVTERFDKVVLNMEKLDYLSSAGLRLLKRAYVAMNRKGGSLVLKNVNELIMEVLEMTGFAGILTIV